MPDKDVPLKVIEEAVESLLPAVAGGDFTMQMVLKAVGAGKSQKLQERIERFLDGDGRFFSDGRGSFRLKSGFFRNFAFPITPDAWEIENGILFPGHRFAPFIAPEIFPSEVHFTAADGSEPERHEVTAPLSQVFHYHLLLGSEQVFDFFLADSPANAGIRNSAKPTDLVTLNVFDLGAFYREHDFRKGDALLCKVLDYDAGCVEFRYLPGDERKESDLAAFVQQFDKALDLVIDRFENYLEIPEQLCWACYCGREFLPPAERAASCDEYLHRTGAIELRCDGDHTVLDRRQTENDDEYQPELPEGMRFSRGETAEITAMLREIGSPLSPVEIDSFILDNCYARELEFEDFFARAFGREKLHFVDEGQQAVFYNYIEDRFEELTGNYNRVDDELKAPLRSTIMELVGDRLEFFDFLESTGEKLDQLPQEKVHRLAEVSMQLVEILKMLNDPRFTPDETELDQLTETVEQRADDQEALIAELSDSVAKEE